MLTKSLLKYYIDCLKYESYYAVQLNPADLTQAQIDLTNIENVIERYEKLSKYLKEDCTIMFGYPLLKIIKKGKTSYLPLILWNSSTFQADHNFFKIDQCGFHQEVYKSLADKHSLEILTSLKEQFSSNPVEFLTDDTMISQLLDITDFEKRQIFPTYTIIQAKNIRLAS